MKVCVVSYHSCPYAFLGGETAGGMSVYLKELLSILAGYEGLDIDIYTRNRDSRHKKVKDMKDSLRVVHIDAGPPGPLDRTRLFPYVPEFIQNMEKFMAVEKKTYDIIHSHYWLSGLIGEWIRLNYSVPLVHTYHTLQYFKERAPGGEGDEIRGMAEEHISKVADTIISSSEQERHFLVDMMGVDPDKCRIIQPGVNPGVFRPAEGGEVNEEIGSAKEKLVMIYVGRIEPIKGLAGVVDVLNILRGRSPDVYEKFKLVVVGGGRIDGDFQTNEEIGLIKSRLDELHVADKMLFLGSREQRELYKYYSAADALFFPTHYESFGLVVGEAMACGRPVLASGIGEMTTFIEEGKNGFTFSAEDPSAAADAIILFDRQRHSFWKGEKIRRHILKKLSWEKTAAKIYKEFKNLENVRPEPTTISRHDENLQPI
jgi:D-inositol-3-phosphate glycosyltransferase